MRAPFCLVLFVLVIGGCHPTEPHTDGDNSDLPSIVESFDLLIDDLAACGMTGAPCCDSGACQSGCCTVYGFCAAGYELTACGGLGACTDCTALPNATLTFCSAGTCVIETCAKGHDDCNRMVADGCEVNDQTDTNNCGQCATVCATRSCVHGACDALFRAEVAYPAGANPVSVALGDLNDDGYLDLAVANLGDGTVSVLPNAGAGGGGTFGPAMNLPANLGNNLQSVAIDDLNGDSRLDLCVVGATPANDMSLFFGKEPGVFADPVSLNAGTDPAGLAVGDLTGHLVLDIAVADGTTGNVNVLLNKDNGTFPPAVQYSAGADAIAVAIGDLNHDGLADLAVVVPEAGAVSVLLNQQNGTFVAADSYGAGERPVAVAIADLNEDGSPDLVVADYDGGGVSVLLNDGTGAFPSFLEYAAGTNPRSVAIGDLDGNGKPDIAVANQGSDDVSVLINNGDGTFAAPIRYGAGTGPSSVAIGDVDNDGKLDLVVTNQGSGDVSVLINMSE